MIKTRRGQLTQPTFFPDGTIGVVRSVDARDLENAGIEGLVTSTFHLLVHGVEADLHGLMKWDRPILTDSGGFQVFSLLKANPKSGKIEERGVTFSWNGRQIDFTPEISIQTQLKLGADILICLDQCTDPEEDDNFQIEAVEKTIAWARRCKDEFTKLTKETRDKPLLFAVIQGGNSRELRQRCAEELIKIGFDGYCYGGWPVDGEKVLLEEILEHTAKLMPDQLPKYALGVGKPEDIVKCFKMGYGIFDCVIPTREARHKRLYVFEEGIKNNDLEGNFYKTVAVNASFANDRGPISKDCDCHTCQHFSREYLYHLFKIKDTLAYRLATIHNLRFYAMLMERLKG